MSHDGKLMVSWNQDAVISWVESLPTDSDFSSKVKQDIIEGIKQYQQKNDTEVTGEDICDAEDPGDIAVLVVGLDKKKSKALFKRICKHRDNEYEQKEQENGGTSSTSDENQTFDINLNAQQGKPITIRGVTRKTTIREIKARFLEEQGDQVAADKVRLKDKWVKKEEGRISIKCLGETPSDDSTLEDCKIINANSMPLTVIFRVVGGAEEKHADDQDDEDRYRRRKLRFKKHKGVIQKSKKADCIMGYTDSDGIPRAEMPCGCAIASDTMWRYMKSLFEKDFKSTKLCCPTPKNLCGGTDKQREWDWSLIFAIADLSQKEIFKYSRIIHDRVSGTKDCPNCGASTEKPTGVRIWRVHCTACKKSDWCWACRGVWKASGLGPICGNQNCMGAQINEILKRCPWLKPEWSIKNENGMVPQIRACPNCVTTLEYTKACKHMVCLCCPYEFCFHCLRKWGSGASECNLSISCELAPTQVFK